MTKYEIILKPNLSELEKNQAYNLMGFVMLGYKVKHTVSQEAMAKLQTHGLILSAKPVTIMY